MQSIYKVCPICGGIGNHNEHTGVWNVEKSLLKKMNTEANRIANAMFDGSWDYSSKIDPALTKLVAGNLADGVINGFGTNFPDLEFGSKDWNMLANLEKNVYSFSAAKNYHQLKEMNAALKDAEGNLRPLPDFIKEVKVINEVYNHAWLTTEYNTAVNGAILASRWNDFQDNADIMPNLQYETVGDGRVREEHAALDGVIKSIDDPFWDVWYPPNGYNCRCTVNQLTGGSPTPNKKISYPEVDKAFSVNLAKKEIVFPPGHPYYDMSKGDKKAIKTEIDKIIPDRSKE